MVLYVHRNHMAYSYYIGTGEEWDRECEHRPIRTLFTQGLSSELLPLHTYQPIYLSTHIPINPYTVYQYKILSFFWGGGGVHIGKWIQENIIFMRFCCFKLSQKIQKLSNEQPTHAIAKWTLTGLVLRNLFRSEI